MVLIVTEPTDVSSRIVANYLATSDIPYRYLYSLDDKLDIYALEKAIQQYTGVWLRRGLHFARGTSWNPTFESQRKVLDGYLHHLYENTSNCIGSLHAEYNHNKLIDLNIAKSCNLTIPFTTIVSERHQLIDLIKQNDRNNFITKSMKDSIRVEDNGTIYHYGYTMRIARDTVVSLPEKFYPSLVQEEIAKDYEVRVFYLKGKCYSMAIFSQENEKTQLDYRYYDDKNSNRNIPYQLEGSLEEKINMFMSIKKLNCGSIDLMVDKNGEYYFLEVNPVGQFGWLSNNCNYYLEREIAKALVNS